MKKLGIKKNRKYYLAILFVVALVLLPTHEVKAFELFGIGDFAYGAVVSMFVYFTFIIFSIAGQIIGFLAEALYHIVNIRVYPNGGLAVIDESWKIMRNFANMFFIVALIVMAFATIFNITKYEARTLFPKFLISALLINFSLVLGVLVIDASQVLSNTFLVSIGNFSNRLGESFINSSIDGELLPTKGAIDKIAGSGGIEGAVFGTLIRLIFAGVLFFTLIFSLLTAAIFAIIRIPILWALLVVSPIAWMLNIFPAGQSTYKKWWSLFIGWNMFLPIFLFFLYFGLYFLQSQGEIMAKIGNQTKDYKFPGGLTLQTLFFYVLTSIFLIGGTITAMKASMFSGTGVVSVAKWSRGIAARRLGLTAAGGAAMQKVEQVQKEGLPTRFGQAIFGGQRALDLETARRARQFGVRGALEKGVEIEKEKQKPYANNVNRLRELAVGGSREQQLAARARLAELGDKESLNFDRIQETYRMAGGERSELANKILGSIDTSKLDTATRKRFSNWGVIKNNTELFKKNALATIEKDKLDESEVEGLARQLVNDADVKEFLDKGIKKNLLAVAKTRVTMGIEGAKAVDKEMEKAFGKMKNEEILEFMNDPSFRTMLDGVRERKRRGEPPTDDDKIVDAMNNTLGRNPKKLAALIPLASGNTQRTLETMAKVRRREQNKPKIAAFRKQEQSLIPNINQTRQDLTNIENQITNLENQINPNTPTSDVNKQLQRQVDQLEKQRTAKENEVKSLSDKRDKINEKIDNLKKGEPAVPTTS